MWKHEHRRGDRAFSGLFLLTIGVFLLLGNLDLIPMRTVATHWWPVILFIIGIKHLVVMRGRAAWVGGLFWMSTGALFLASTLGYLTVGIPDMLWPVMLIWGGIYIAWGPVGHCGSRAFNDGRQS